MKYQAQIFVCTNERPEGNPRGCCKTRGGELVLEKFKEEINKHGLKNKNGVRIRAQKSGCHDFCERGPVVVIYPEGVFYGGVQPEDVSEIVEKHLLQHQKVERLEF